MRLTLSGPLFALTCLACSAIEERELTRVGQVTGQVGLSEGSRGDVYLFLFPRGAGASEEAARPRYVTAISDGRLKSGDARYVFGAVQPNPYRLEGFLDADRNFQGGIDVLSQPGAGDRLASSFQLNLQPGQTLTQDLPLTQVVTREPPAFEVDAQAVEEFEFPDQPGIVSLALVPLKLPGILEGDLSFRVSLADADGDGRPDDDNGDGIPDLYPQTFLRFLPRPGQTVPTDPGGQPATVIVPLAFNPAPFLSSLAGDLSREVAVDRLQLFLLPQAQAVAYPAGKGRVVSPLEAVPVGAYELVMLTRAGQYWRIPNDLAGEAGRQVGGPYPGQGVRFRVVHGAGFDGGGR